jgi:hypothetical protein
MVAIQLMNLKVARVLLADPRVDVNATDTSGLTALHQATGKRLSAIILSQRTDIDWKVVDKTGNTTASLGKDELSKKYPGAEQNQISGVIRKIHS